MNNIRKYLVSAVSAIAVSDAFRVLTIKRKLEMSHGLVSPWPTPSHALIKLLIVGILLTCSVRVLASCQGSESEGWEIFSICEATFDSQGNYVSSRCNLGPAPEPSQTSVNMCKAAPEVGGCSGSACSYLLIQ